MKSQLLKKYWWLIALIITFLTLMLFPEKTLLWKKISKSEPETSSSPKTEQQGDESQSENWLFTSVTPVKYRPMAYQEFPINGEAADPKVSPDGSKVVFVLKTGSATDLAILDLSTNTIIPLNIKLDEISHPAWDSEGTKIVFAGKKGNASEIYTYEIIGKLLFQATNDQTRKKYWPRFSPYKFDRHYRIAYASEEKGRKDVWWVRANGENDMPLTFSSENASKYKNYFLQAWGDAGVPRRLPSAGGDCPEWSPSGFEILYRVYPDKYASIVYTYYSWWYEKQPLVATSPGILAYAPNQSSLLEYNPKEQIANRILLDKGAKQDILTGKKPTSMPAYFPDGKALVYIQQVNNRTVLSVEPINDPLGDVVNLWMYQYSDGQREKIGKNQLLFLHSKNDQIYSIYESEFYVCSRPDEYGHARPYFVTSDAVLETFYAAFASLLSYTERSEFVQALTEFATKGYEIAKAKKAADDIQNFFLTGFSLLKSDQALELPAVVKEEIRRIQRASGIVDSLFGQKLDYDEFLIRGKYERDMDLQKYFQALKWFQTFKFDLSNERDRRWVIGLQEILNESEVYKPLEKINLRLIDTIGESRYYGPTNLKKLTVDGMVPAIESAVPWLKMEYSYKLFPALYTLDSYVFDELIFHSKRSETVGTLENPRLLPAGLDIMASFGSGEAKKILIEEMKEDRFNNYENMLLKVTKKIESLPSAIWDSNLYHSWLGMLHALVDDTPVNAPEFTRSQAWKRKELNTALGSWVNLRYETAAYVEKVVAECGEAGYEPVVIGLPKGYVEPNPEFFKRLNAGFEKIRKRFKEVVIEKDLQNAIDERIGIFQEHLVVLERISRKELANTALTDEEYEEILFIGRTIEHFILIINSVSTDRDSSRGLSNPDSIEKIVDVQSSPSGEKLYEGLGPANEINVIVPYFGRRQIVKGPVYSYYEFRSDEIWKNDRWRSEFDMQKGLPSWIKSYYEGKATSPIPGRSNN